MCEAAVVAGLRILPHTGNDAAIYFDPVEANQQVVYFNATDYAGPVRRMIAFILDQLTILFLLIVMLAGSVYPFPPDVKARLAATEDRAE